MFKDVSVDLTDKLPLVQGESIREGLKEQIFLEGLGVKALLIRFCPALT